MNDFKDFWEWIIFKSNIKGDSLGKIVYDDLPVTKVVSESIAIKDDYLYLGGRTWDTSGKGENIMVVKMDKNGNVIKEERFLQVIDSDIDYSLHDIVKLDDGNFILVYTYKYDRGRIPGIIKFDKNLNYIWHREFVNSNTYHQFPGITALDNGNVLVNWELYTPDIKDELGEKYKKVGRYPNILYKIDKYGNTIWTDTMWTLNYEGEYIAPKGEIKMMEMTSEGDIIGTGVYNNYYFPPRTWAWIFKYSKDGELLWEKIYEDQNINENYSKFYDIMEAPNGDIVCTGQMTDDDVWGGNADYTWVLRVDSDGCFEPGCGVADSVQLVYTYSDLVTGTNEVESDYSYQNDIKIYPNPSSTEINVELSSDIKISKWNIFDIQGNKIISGTRENVNKIDVSPLKSGLYYLEVIDDKGRSVVGKFVVE